MPPTGEWPVHFTLFGKIGIVIGIVIAIDIEIDPASDWDPDAVRSLSAVAGVNPHPFGPRGEPEHPLRRKKPHRVTTGKRRYFSSL